MRIGVYCDDFDPKEGGASSLTKTIISEILDYQKSNNQFDFVLMYSDKRKPMLSNEHNELKYINVSHELSHTYRIRRKIDKRLNRNHVMKEFDMIAKKNQIDIIWFCNPIMADISIPYIFTVWDLGHRTVPYFPEVSYGMEGMGREQLFKTMLTHASWILTGNSVGKKEILSNYSFPEERIKIAPFPVSHFCRGKEIKPNFDLPKEFFIYPAQFWAHKNHIIILKALKYIKDSSMHRPIVFFTGSDKGNKNYIMQKAIEYGIEEQIIFTGFLLDEELKYMYTHATALIFASLMGPNNLPPIEAAYLKCPVIISNIEGHIEQMGDCAMYFDGTDEAGLANCIMDMQKKDVREEFVFKLNAKAVELEQIKYIEPVINIFMQFDKFLKCWK